MSKLATTYLGLELAHPFMAGAGPIAKTLDGVRTLEDGGASAIVLNSLYAEQIREESRATHASLHDPAESFGEALSYLPTPDEFSIGPDDYLGHLADAVEAVSVPVFGSLNGSEMGDWIEYATMMEHAGAAGIELNLYDVVTDPSMTAATVEDTSVQIVREVRAKTKLPLAVKLSPFYTALPHFAGRLVDAGATGLVLFNRFFEPDIDCEQLEFVPHLALSDPTDLLLRLRWLAILRSTVHCPMAVTGGVHDVRGAAQALMCGANAVQLVASVLVCGTDVFTRLRDEIAEWLEEGEYKSLEDLIGSMSMARCPNPGALTRAQYVRSLSSWVPR